MGSLGGCDELARIGNRSTQLEHSADFVGVCERNPTKLPCANCCGSRLPIARDVRCALHPGVICPRGWRSLHLCTVMGCFPPIGGYTKSGAMLVVMAKKMPHHGAAILGGTPSLWSAWMERTPAPGANDPWMEGAPCKAYCCQWQSLDGYTCQGTPSLMDRPQIKPSHQVEPPVHAWKPQPQLSSCRAVETVETVELSSLTA